MLDVDVEHVARGELTWNGELLDGYDALALVTDVHQRSFGADLYQRALYDFTFREVLQG